MNGEMPAVYEGRELFYTKGNVSSAKYCKRESWIQTLFCPYQVLYDLKKTILTLTKCIYVKQNNQAKNTQKTNPKNKSSGF